MDVNVTVCRHICSVRYNSLSEPLQRRGETLEAWQVLFQFYRDLEEEVAWLSDRLPSITAKDWGSSLSSTQQLLHKHQVNFSDKHTNLSFIPLLRRKAVGET